MTCIIRRLMLMALLAAGGGIGCSSTGYFWGSDDCDECGGRRARRWSEEWYAQRADSPPGTRQRHRFGKLWPPYPRPTGEEQEFIHRYHTAHYWPHPYVCWDRAYVREVSQAQINNGWIKETTLYDYHFEEEGHDLDRSGWMHLEWILKHVPPTHRVVWVQAAFDPELSQQRLVAVQAAVEEMVSGDSVPPIMLRIDTPVGRPAVENDLIRRAEMETIPDPRITYEALPSGTSN